MSPSELPPSLSELDEEDEELDEDEEDEELDLLGRWMCISGMLSDESDEELSDDEPLEELDEPLEDMPGMSSFEDEAEPDSRWGGGPPCLSGDWSAESCIPYFDFWSGGMWRSIFMTSWLKA